MVDMKNSLCYGGIGPGILIEVCAIEQGRAFVFKFGKIDLTDLVAFVKLFASVRVRKMNMARRFLHNYSITPISPLSPHTLNDHSHLV